MPDSSDSVKNTSSARRWVSFFIACVIFTIGWLITGDSANITDMPWWGFLVVLLIQAIILTAWNGIKPSVAR